MTFSRTLDLRKPAAYLTVLLLTLGLLLSGCVAADKKVGLKGEEFKITRVAITREEQARGLMFVEHMPQDEGMLFVFTREAPRSFWMKNTRIALDIFYFDAALRLVSVAENARPCVADPCPSYPSRGVAQYVLELNAGTAARLGVGPGDELVLHFDPLK